MPTEPPPPTASAPAAPKVFISYSRDPKEHDNWVLRFAHRLRASGINVVLDQWHLRPGANVPAFMEFPLKSSDRVLIICTEEYVRKAETANSGVAYEQMVVTAEIAENLETVKFIPILRNIGKERLPPFLASRLHIDLSSDEFNDPSKYGPTRRCTGALSANFTTSRPIRYLHSVRGRLSMTVTRRRKRRRTVSHVRMQEQPRLAPGSDRIQPRKRVQQFRLLRRRDIIGMGRFIATVGIPCTLFCCVFRRTAFFSETVFSMTSLALVSRTI